MAREVNQVRPSARANSSKEDDSKYWRDKAACKGMDPDIWYDGVKVRPGGVRVDPYKICKACPVIRECLKDSIEVEGIIAYGIRGGMSAEDRRAIVRSWRFTNVQG